jgi:hypothetical protein
MIKMAQLPPLQGRSLVWVMVLTLSFACGEDKTPLAPYAGQPEMSSLLVEEGTHIPRFTWLGGYVAVLGVNQGPAAALDSTLLWLIYTNGNNIHFPVTFNQLPPGAEDLTTRYGGRHVDKFLEDTTYTFWVLKAETWSQVAANAGKPLRTNPNPTSAPVEVRSDTVIINSMNHLQNTRTIDVYTNIKEIRPTDKLGILAEINVQQSYTSNNPIVTWKIRQSGVTDSLISAFGLLIGTAYDPNTTVWEVWSEEVIGGVSIFGKKNVIRSPIVMGQAFPETRVFTQYPAEGLERDKDYVFWVANKDWDGVDHRRSARNHAYIKFRTW